MATPGNTYSTLVLEAWESELESTIFWNNFMFNNSIFQVKDSPGGTTINTGYEYSVSTNAAAYSYSDPMPDAFVLSQVRAYFNKDHFQEAARIFNVYADYAKNGGTQVPLDMARDSIEKGTKNLLDLACTTMLTDVEAQAASSSTYSDGSLSCSTYDMAAYVESTSTALTLAHMEDAEEALLTHTTYGNAVGGRESLVWLMPQNQFTNLSRLGAGVAYNSTFNNFTTSSDPNVQSDYGRQARMVRFNGIDLITVPDMTTTTLLLLHKPDLFVYRTRPLTIVEKSELADTMLWHLTCGYNAVVKNPKNHAALTSKTA